MQTTKIQRHFHASAVRYEQAALLHHQIAEMILVQLSSLTQKARILDVGCGTGHLTGRLKEKFPDAAITGLDFAAGMIEQARSKHKTIEWVLADCHKMPFPDAHFEVVASNAAYQWAHDLTAAFAEARRILVPGGVLVGSLFGYQTCGELFQILGEFKGLQFDRLPDEEKLQQALAQGGFSDFQVTREQLQIPFKDMPALLAWLKTMGANNLAKAGFIGKETLSRATALYKEHFSCPDGVQATFEIFYVHAQK